MMPGGRPKGSKDKVPRKPTGERRGCTKEIELEDGYNTRKIRFMRMIIPKESLDLNDVDEMERRFDRYLALCEEYDMKVGNMAAYTAIGLDKGLVWEIVHGRMKVNPRTSDFVKNVQKTCAMYRECLMEDGKINPVTGIFWQKNYDGMKDQQEVVVTPNNVLGEQKTDEQLAEKYLNAVGKKSDPILIEEIPSSSSTLTALDSEKLAVTN